MLRFLLSLGVIAPISLSLSEDFDPTGDDDENPVLQPFVSYFAYKQQQFFLVFKIMSHNIPTH